MAKTKAVETAGLTDTALIRLRMQEVLRDPSALAQAVVAAAKTLQALGSSESGTSLAAMSRAELQVEINRVRAQLGLKPLD